MTPSTLTADAALAIIRRDALLLVSYRFFFISQVLQGVFTVTTFYFVSRVVKGVEGFAESPDRYFAAIVVGVLIMQLVTASLVQLPTLIRQELVAGTFERLVLSPFGAVGAIMSMTVVPFLLTLLLSVVTLVFGIVVFGLGLHWDTVILAVPLSAAAAFAFVPFALLLAAAVILAKQAGVGVGFVIPLISLASGVLFPLALLPGWIRWVSDAQPFTPALELMRNVLVGTPLSHSAWAELAKLAGFTVLLLPLGVLAVRGAVRVGRRRGTITEY